LGETGRQPQIVGLLQRETEGNVFFLVEVVRALAEEAGRLDKIGHMTLPEHVFAGGIRKIIQRRLNRVPRESRVLLEFAAVIGRQLDLALLKQIAPDTDLDRWLTDCANAAVLDVDADMWRFAHDKLRDGMLNELTDAEQQVLHRRVAQAMEALYGASPQHTVALAYHWGEAGDAGKEEYYTTLAGQQALSSGAFREAAMFLQRALLLVSQPKAARPDQLDQKEIELKARLAEAYLGFGRYEDAQRLYNENLAVYRAAQHQQGTADMLCKLGDVALALAAPEAARDLYEQALEIYRAIGDQGSVARALNSLGNVAYELGEQTSAKALFQESLNLARELGDQWGMAGSLSKAGGGSGAAQQEARRAALLSTLDAQHSAGDQPGIADTLQALGALAHEIGDLGEAQQLYRRSLTIRRALNQPDDVLHLLDQLGRVATAARAYADARGYLREALSQAAGARQMAQVMRVLGNLAGLYAAEDRHEQALELIAFVISHPDTDEETQNRVEGLLVELEDQVAPKLIEGAWERGKSRQFDDLLRETLR
jgi:tetratricopeptide (TPR) repeat protein